MSRINYPPGSILLASLNSGSTNNSNSGSGAYIDHTPAFTLPANFMTAARPFRLTAHFQITSGSAPPSVLYRVKLGSTVIYSSASVAPTANLANVQIMLQWLFQAVAAPGASSNVQCAALNQATGPITPRPGQTAMPVAVATNAALEVTIATQWTAAGTGTSTIGLNQYILEALN